MARRKAPQFPADILAMSLEELKQESDKQFNEENQAKFDALVEARDAAQERFHAHTERFHLILQRYVQLHEQQKRDDE